MNTAGNSRWAPVSSFFQKIGLDYFIAGILGMILLAKIYPEGGLDKGRFSLPDLAGWGVTLIFFFYGLKLNKEKLLLGLFNWKLHVLVQSATFIIFPLLLLSVKSWFNEDEYLWLGAFFLASLPSTVSSSVVMVSVAGGNIAAAIFNASISGILGIVITPLWMNQILSSETESADLSTAITKLLLQVLLPVILGFLFNRKWGKLADKHKHQLKIYDQCIILSIVYTSFAESFHQDMFSNMQWSMIVLLGLSMLSLFFLVFFMINLLCRLLRFTHEDRITAVFCGSKKSLVHGTVMSKILFQNSNATGIILLPLMFYHALQLMATAIIARRWSLKTPENQ